MHQAKKFENVLSWSYIFVDQQQALAFDELLNKIVTSSSSSSSSSNSHLHLSTDVRLILSFGLLPSLDAAGKQYSQSFPCLICRSAWH
jgi:hypothetical protein